MMRWLFPFFWTGIACADIALVGGFAQSVIGSDFPFFQISGSFYPGTPQMKLNGFPIISDAFINDIAVDPNSGNVLYILGGDYSPYPAFAYLGSVAGPNVIGIPLNTTEPDSFLSVVAYDQNGNAIIAGEDFYGDLPRVFLLPSGSTELVEISVPGTNPVLIKAIAVTSNNVAIIVGQDQNTSKPVAYQYQAGQSAVSVLTIPSVPAVSEFSCVASFGETALIGGVDSGSGNSLIYRYSNGALTKISVAVLGDSQGVTSIAFAPDGTATLVGKINTIEGDFPLIYRVGLSSTSATTINNANANTGSPNAVAVDSYGNAWIGGLDQTLDTPLFWMLPSGATTAVQRELPTSDIGYIQNLAVGSQNEVVIIGSYTDINLPLIWTMNSGDTVPTRVLGYGTSLYQFYYLNFLNIYKCGGDYDIQRIIPYHNYESTQAVQTLTQAGIP
jgi:hypothetical protein